MLDRDIPSFGVLSDVNVICAAGSVAGPYAALMMAEMGAHVLWIENPKSPDQNRQYKNLNAEDQRRNMRNLSIDFLTPEGREVLFKLLKNADVYIEASKGGQYERWGLSDEVLWEVNPKLVILHVSGFGQTGDPKFVEKACYDTIAQAFSGFMNIQGYPDRPAVPTQTLTTDYITGISGAALILGALHQANRTGQGDSIDLAQYEVLLKCQGQWLMDYTVLGVPAVRQGADFEPYSLWGSFACGDGKACYMQAFGAPQVKIILPLIGLEYGSEEYPAGVPCYGRYTPQGKEIEKRLHALAESMTAKEFEELLWDKGVACCRIQEYEDVVTHPHVIARESFVEWDAEPGSPYEGRKIKGPRAVSHYKKAGDSIVWRGCVNLGEDNEDILSEIGYSDAEIAKLYEDKVIVKIESKVITR